MNHLLMVKKYLEAKTGSAGIQSTGLPFVTISRQAAAGGHLLSQVIVTDFLKLNGDVFRDWHVFDREICELVALDPSLNTSMEQLVHERYRSEFSEFMDGLFSGQSTQYMTLKKTFTIVHILASLGKVIIVGRAGSSVTRSLGTGIHLRLVAPEPNRVRWMMKKLRMGKEEAQELIARQDKERVRMTKTFFNRSIEDPLLYDLTINSATVQPHEISHCVIEMIKNRFNLDGTSKTAE